MAEFTFEIKQHIAQLSSSEKGWIKELNLVSWNNAEPKYDIRTWDAKHEKMGKGVTLTLEETKTLKKILNDMSEL